MIKIKIFVIAFLLFALLLSACQTAAQSTAVSDAVTSAETAVAGEQVPETGATAVEALKSCTSGITEEELRNAGEAVYASTCAGCHGPQGEGKDQFPPLANSQVATADDLVELAKKVTDPSVHPFITTINANDFAAALSFVRSSFGNKAPIVCPDDIPLPTGQ